MLYNGKIPWTEDDTAALLERTGDLSESAQELLPVIIDLINQFATITGTNTGFALVNLDMESFASNPRFLLRMTKTT